MLSDVRRFFFPVDLSACRKVAFPQTSTLDSIYFSMYICSVSEVLWEKVNQEGALQKAFPLSVLSIRGRHSATGRPKANISTNIGLF